MRPYAAETSLIISSNSSLLRSDEDPLVSQLSRDWSGTEEEPAAMLSYVSGAEDEYCTPWAVAKLDEPGVDAVEFSL